MSAPLVDRIPPWFLIQHAFGQSRIATTGGKRVVPRPAASTDTKELPPKIPCRDLVAPSATTTSASDQDSIRHYEAVKASFRANAIAGGAEQLPTSRRSSLAVVSEDDEQPASNLAGASGSFRALKMLSSTGRLKVPRGESASDPFNRLHYQAEFEASFRNFDGRLPLALRRTATLKTIHMNHVPQAASPSPAAETCLDAGDQSSAKIAPGSATRSGPPRGPATWRDTCACSPAPGSECCAAGPRTPRTPRTPEMRAAARWSWLLSGEEPSPRRPSTSQATTAPPHAGDAFAPGGETPEGAFAYERSVGASWDELLPRNTSAPPAPTASAPRKKNEKRKTKKEERGTKQRSTSLPRSKRAPQLSLSSPHPPKPPPLPPPPPRFTSPRRESLSILLSLADTHSRGKVSLHPTAAAYPYHSYQGDDDTCDTDALPPWDSRREGNIGRGYV